MTLSLFKLSPEDRVPWLLAFTHRWVTNYDKEWNPTGRELKFGQGRIEENLIGACFGGPPSWLIAAIARDRVLPRSASPISVMVVAAVTGVVLGYVSHYLLERKRLAP